jgi:hypothetical protein
VIAASIAAADVVYTDVPDQNLYGPPVQIDLDGDGVAELESHLYITDWFECLCAADGLALDTGPGVETARADGGPFAAGLAAGAPVDGTLPLAEGQVSVWEDWSACCDDPPYCIGDWCEQGTALSVGIRFLVAGNEHYGWLRMRHLGPFAFELLDYAYESEPLTPLPAGMAFRDCNGNDIPDADDIAGGTSDDVDRDGVPDECQCPDTDGDGVVGVDDLVSVLLDWGCRAGDAPCTGDANGDGAVDVDDVVAVVLAWGPCPK